MHIGLIILGAMVGLALGVKFEGGTSLFGMIVGGIAGYGFAELASLRAGARQLQTELDLLKERVNALWRRQKEKEQEPGAQEASAPSQKPEAAAQTFKAAEESREEVWMSEPVEPARPARAEPGVASVKATVMSRVPASAANNTGGASTGGAIHNTSNTSGWKATASAPSPDRRYGAYESSFSASPGSDSGGGSLFDIPLFRILRDYFTGGNTLVRVGVLILFFGVAFLLRYLAEHSHVPIQFRLCGVACGGVILLVLGWRLRSRRLGYALALQGGGVGILYLTTFAALRLYSLLPPAIAFGLLVAIAACTAVLAVWQDSQAFASLAVTGGFLAPILASTGEGSHIVLFSYYAVVNAGILAIAWYKAWRPLNVLGFAFTFIISTAWGALRYQDSLFASTEPFLVVFFLFYVAIAILFSLRQPPQLRGYVDGTLLFGTPAAAFGYQSAMLHDRPTALALSAVVLGAFYLLLAWVLHRGKRSSQGLLVEAFMALGVVFLTIAAPIGLSSHKTGATWALEAVALVWVGVRQDRVLARMFGLLVQVGAGLVLLNNIDQWDTDWASLGNFLARTLVAAGAVFSAWMLQKYSERLRDPERVGIPVLFFFGLLVWLVSALHQLEHYFAAPYVTAAEIGFVGLTALVCSELARRTVLTLAELPALLLLPALLMLVLIEAVSGVHHPFENGGWLAWAFDLACLYLVLHRHEGDPEKPWVAWAHAVAAWLTVGLPTWELAWEVDNKMSGHGPWAVDSLILIPAFSLAVLPRLVARFSWPFRVHRQAYVMMFGALTGLYLVLWSLVTNFSLNGDPYPFPYVPLLNSLDLAQLLVLLVVARFWTYLRTLQELPESEISAAAAGSVGFLGFVWLNAALCRTLHHWAGVPFDFDSLTQSTLVQTALSIFWTVLALATMLTATRRASRRVWLTGAILLAVTIVKLFVVDLSRVGSIERIVSFVGVGLLTLVIGYFSPLPPSAKEDQTAVP